MLPVQDKTEVLIEALPYFRRYEGTVFVVKYGGAAMVDEKLQESVAKDVVLLKKVGINIIIVHGGGKEVTDIATRLGIPTQFIEGQRFTDAPMMEVVQMVLAGKTNKDIVARINRYDGNAVGVCGIDASLLRVRRYAAEGKDLGLVGEITGVNDGYLDLLLRNSILPVIAPIGVDDEGTVYNINADIAAANIAAAMKAEKLVYLSDVEGVFADGALIRSMDQEKARRLIESGIINNGMIPKIRSAFMALEKSVRKVHLIDGRARHSLLAEIFTDEGIGTELIHSAEAERQPYTDGRGNQAGRENQP